MTQITHNNTNEYLSDQAELLFLVQSTSDGGSVVYCLATMLEQRPLHMTAYPRSEFTDASSSVIDSNIAVIGTL